MSIRLIVTLISSCLLGSCADPGESIPEGDASTEDCQGDQLLACVCDGGVNGVAFCEDGAWTECDCEDDGEYPMFCGLCHGDWDYPAPPLDTKGNSSSSEVTVGAHRAHLVASDWHREVECSDCHVVPTGIETPGHVDESPAELPFSSVASAAGAMPGFDRGSATCTGVYCHGGTTGPGGTNNTPKWTVVDGTQAVCGACHGLPPGGGHPDNAECASCHGSVVDDGLSFVKPGLHVNGQTDFSSGGTACTACHGNPPTPGDQDFPGGGGAHARHVAEQGMACSTCHGHNGSGTDHAEAATVLQENVDIVFDATVAYPGGTTATNGATPSFDHDGASPTCYVGCHNPVVDDGADLANVAVWTDTIIACSDCHERPGLAPPWNHDIDGTDSEVRANCSVCHDTSTHASGVLALADPDLADGIDPTSPGSVVSDLCRTCHDGGGGAFFAGAVPVDVSESWVSHRAHEANGIACVSCHGYHGGNPGDDLVATTEESGCGGASCHGDIVGEMGLAGGYSRHHVVDSEQSAGQLECVTCHAPHAVDDSPWQPVTDPDDGSLVATGDVPGDHFSTSDGNTGAFCLDCHDGTWAAASNIAGELADAGTSNTGFVATAGPTAGSNLHHSHVGTHGFSCTHCHNAHSNTGTAGTNRGRLLYDFISVNTFPYMGKGTCQFAGGPTGCHH